MNFNFKLHSKSHVTAMKQQNRIYIPQVNLVSVEVSTNLSIILITFPYTSELPDYQLTSDYSFEFAILCVFVVCELSVTIACANLAVLLWSDDLVACEQKILASIGYSRDASQFGTVLMSMNISPNFRARSNTSVLIIREHLHQICCNLKHLTGMDNEHHRNLSTLTAP